MKWVKEWNCFIKCNKFANEFCKSSKWYHMVDKVQNAADNSSKILNPSGMLQRSSMGGRRMIFWQGQMLVSVAPRGFEVNSDIGNCRNRMRISVVRGFTQSSRNEPHLTRDWMVKLWLEEKKTRKPRRAKKSKAVQRGQSQGSWFDAFSSFKLPATRWFKDGRLAEQRFDNSEKLVIKQPPFSQSTTHFLKPTTAEEATIAPLLARDNLLITRDIEWANLMLGFEQENRYAIVDPCYPQSPVGFMREQSNVIFRQLLRSRRPFIAYITDAMGNELFRVRRPIWFINSTIYAEVDGKEIGVVHRRWHLWRRVYDLYLGNKQFAVVENPGFWNWTFTLKDSDGNVLAEIDRDWRGIGFELFTDAGQYAIRFGNLAPRPTTGPAREIQQLNISRSLTLSERATALALAVSLDNDYFSRHGGWGIPFFAVEE